MVRTGHAPRNLSTIRKFALTLLRQDQQYPKRSMPSRCKALHAGLNLHLTKPFDPRELIHVIAKRAMALGSS